MEKNKRNKNHIRKSVDINLLKKNKNINNIYIKKEESLDNKTNKKVDISPLNLNNSFLNNNNNNNFNNLVLSLKKENKNSEDNIKKGNKKQAIKTKTPDTKLIYIKINNHKMKDLENSLIQSDETKNNKNNNELNNSYNF